MFTTKHTHAASPNNAFVLRGNKIVFELTATLLWLAAYPLCSWLADEAHHICFFFGYIPSRVMLNFVVTKFPA